MFTLSGAHVFPMYDGAVTADPPMRILDVRHEQTAAFAAEAMGKLTRTPGLAVLTAGPGCHQRGQRGRAGAVQRLAAGRGRRPGAREPLGQRVAPGARPAADPGAGLQARAHHPHRRRGRRRACTRRSPLAGSSHRGPVFVDIPMDEFFNASASARPAVGPRRRTEPDGDAIADIAELLGQAQRPVLVLGTDVWADGAEEAALRLVEEAGLPVITNGMGRGVIPGGHPLLVTKARGAALGGADLVVVAGTPLDFRLGYGVFGGKDGATPGARRTPRRLPRPGLPARRPRGRGVRRPHPRPRRAARRGRRAGTPARLVALGQRTSRTPSSRPSTATPSCSAPRPTRSTPPASTASWSRAWPRTRSSSATAATSSPSPASSSSRSVPAAGSTPAPTAASAPASGPPSPPASPARRPRSCCCTATARPACP